MKLNLEQRRIVELEPNGHLLIKGVAGSGKTTVSVRRIPFLLNHYCPDKDDKILLVTFNKTLLNYIKYQYNKFSEDNTEYQVDIFDKGIKNVNIINIDSLMFKYFIRSQKRNKTSYKIANKTLEFKIMVQAINKVREDNPDVKLLNPKNSMFLLDEISWMKACNILFEPIYQEIDRIGRTGGGKGIPQKLNKNSPIRSAIFDLMEYYDYLLELEGFIDFKTMNLIALKESQHNPMDKYTHILIDESQDLTKVQLEFLKCIYQDKSYSSIMFVADNTQSIYSQSWLGKGRAYTTIGYDMSGKSRTLSKNYRTTTQISTAAFDLIEHDENIKNNIDFVKPSLIDRQGHPPIYRYFRDKEKQLEFLYNEIEVLNNDYNYSDICIVARNGRTLEDVSAFLEDKGTSCEILNQKDPNFDSNKVKLLTFHSIKGLEFKVIFLIDVNQVIVPNNSMVDFEDQESNDSEERKLLYVGMTRANELLYMSSVDKPSKFIKEIDNSHLRMKRDCNIKPYETLSTIEYKLIDQVVDINSSEEKVRQWLIKELNTTYNYPLELINLEYPVYNFSRKGYVDIAVNIFNKGEEIPYLFAEVKRFGAGIDEALPQLKSYMETTDNVRYGIVTDGLEIKVINKEGEVLEDIPKCNSNFLPETKEKKEYINFRNNKKYLYSYDKDDVNNIEVSDMESDLIIDCRSYCSIPIVGNVSGGTPIFVNKEYKDSLKIPEDWVFSDKSTFGLKVTGDSMNGIGIDKGDTVIVHQHNTAINGDIVIVVISEEATMKKFMLMGDSVLLLPENNNYEPIQMKLEDIIINGKVIGVMKE